MLHLVVTFVCEIIGIFPGDAAQTADYLKMMMITAHYGTLFTMNMIWMRLRSEFLSSLSIDIVFVACSGCVF